MITRDTLPKFASLFTGFGGADIGALAAGYTPAWGVEYRADIAAVANRNLGEHVRVADVLDCDPRDFAPVDLLHASPPCPNFSVAKKDRGETAHDLAMARKVAEFVTILLPPAFTLENVMAYRESQSWRLIEDQLWQNDYWVHVEIVNAADFGVPQTRRRMIVRAVRNAMPGPLPNPVPWIGWYAAIEDILDTLPESRFAPWQMARLPEWIDDTFISVQQQSNDRKGTEFGYGTPRRPPTEPSFSVTTQAPSWYKAFILTGQYGQPNTADERSAQNVPEDAPSPTVTGSAKGDWRAFLVSNAKTEYSDGVRKADEPSLAVTPQLVGRSKAFLVGGSNTSAELAASGVGISDIDQPTRMIGPSAIRNTRAWLSTGRVVAMTPRALARFQSFPDWYEFPAKRSLAALGIGNAVPPLLYQRIAETLIED